MSRRLIGGCLLIVIIVASLLIGCTSEKITEDDLQESPHVAYLSPPIATVEFYDDNSFYQYEIPLDANTVYSFGEYFRVALIFEEPLKEGSYLAYIKSLENEKLSVYSHNYKKITLFIHKSIGDELNITLDQNIESKEGLKLQEDIYINYLIEEPIKASYTTIGKDYTRSYPDGNAYPQLGGEEEQYTNAEKKIHIKFSEDVDRERIEETLRNKIFSDQQLYTIKWESNRSLHLQTEKLPNGFYSIDLFTYKTPIVNKLNIKTDNPNVLYSYSFVENKVKEERVFKDYRYEFNQNPFIKDYLLMADRENNYFYKFKEDTISEFPESNIPPYLGMGPWVQEIVWLDGDSILWLEGTQVNTYNIKNKTKKTLFEIDELVKEHPTASIFQYTLSPDKDMIAIAMGVRNYEPDEAYAETHVYSMAGRKVYQSRIEDIRVEWAAGHIYLLNMGWLNNYELVHEISNGEQGHSIAITNIKTGTTNIILEDAIRPVANRGVILGRQGENYTINTRGEVISIPTEGILDYFIKDEETLLLIKEKGNITQIVELNLLTRREKILGEINGDRVRFLGLSQDQEKIYFITNQYLLLIIT